MDGVAAGDCKYPLFNEKITDSAFCMVLFCLSALCTGEQTTVGVDGESVHTFWYWQSIFVGQLSLASHLQRGKYDVDA